MASNNLPAGAFLTSIDGRRCTAVPRVQAASSSSTTTTSIDQVTTTLNTIVQTTASPTVATPTTAAVVVAVGNQESAPRIIGDESSASTSTTSSSLEVINTVIPPNPVVATSVVQVVQAQEESPAPVVLPPPATSTPSSPPPAAAPIPDDGNDDSLSQSFTVIAGNTPTQEAPPLQTFQSMIQIQISETNGNIIASPTGAAGAGPGQQPGSPAPGQSSAGILPVGAGGTPLSTTIESPSQPSSNNGGVTGSAGDTNSSNSEVSTVPMPNNSAVRSTLAVAGGVIGGVVAISIIAFLIWWWRRQRLRRRRSTLLTPLNMANPFNEKGGGGVMQINEKGGYVIDRGSIGPTPVATKVRTALGVNLNKIKGHLRNKTGGSSAPSVNMNRGTSQFMDASNASTRSRSNSAFDRDPAEPTVKDRFVDWWSRLTADINFNWKLRNARSSEIDTLTPMGQPPLYAANEKRPPLPGSTQQPDFLTLLNMSDNELDREAQRLRRSSSVPARGPNQRNSAGSGDHFLSGLGLNFADNPFSDAHASATPAPLAVPQTAASVSGVVTVNPFADPVPAKPGTYVSDTIRRSRGHSIATTTYNNINLAPPPTTPGIGRDSLASVGSFVTTNRNKFRSDPFDLELPSTATAFFPPPSANKLSIISSNAGTAGNSSIGGRNSQVSALSSLVGTTGRNGNGGVRKPAGAHVRAESFTSKYSSGISLGDYWSDPGPDVGPLGTGSTTGSVAAGWVGGGEENKETGAAGRRGSNGSGRSQGVGKAM